MTFPLPEILPDVVDHLICHDDIHTLLNSNANVQAGTSYTLVLTDFGKIIRATSATAVSVTVPPEASVAFPTGPTWIHLLQAGAGQLTVVQGAGVTIRTDSTLLARAQWSLLSLWKFASNEWLLAGATL